MKNAMRRIFGGSFFLGILFSLCACNPSKEAISLEACPISHELEFGGVYIAKTIAEFNGLGFQCGDAVTVSFSNGYKLSEVPYYNGYYTANGEALLVGYPGYPYIKAAINNGDDLWNIAGLSENDTASISLAERGKFLDIQEARDLHYFDERSRYPSDAVFANFRSLSGGNIKANRVFRSASPCDNQHMRAPYVDLLAEEAGVEYIVNLADTEAKIDGYISEVGFASPHFLSLYRDGKVSLLGLNMNYASEDFRAKVLDGLRDMINHDGPCLIHCTEGKDRTGFYCALLEALCGASYEQIRTDYLITYQNYYFLDPVKDASKLQVIAESLLDPMMEALGSSAKAKAQAIQNGAIAYVSSGQNGLSPSEVSALQAQLC